MTRYTESIPGKDRMLKIQLLRILTPDSPFSYPAIVTDAPNLITSILPSVENHHDLVIKHVMNSETVWN